VLAEPGASGQTSVSTVSQPRTPRSQTPGLLSFEPDPSIQTISRPPSPRSPTPELPLFHPDPSSPIDEDRPITEQGSPPPLPLSAPIIDDDQELHAQQEVQQQFQWLAKMLDENRKRGWGSGYRDFVDVLLLLRAVSGLGMVEQQNNRISDGVFVASTGSFTLNLTTFIDLMHLEHTSATWRNKLTMYFRLKSLYLYSEHTGGVRFEAQAHRTAWGIVSHWMENHDKFLPVNWVTTRFGSTELRPLLRDMLQEACRSECPNQSFKLIPFVCSMLFYVCFKVAWSIWRSRVDRMGSGKFCMQTSLQQNTQQSCDVKNLSMKSDYKYRGLEPRWFCVQAYFVS
jgi:hypothetical protein